MRNIRAFSRDSSPHGAHFKSDECLEFWLHEPHQAQSLRRKNFEISSFSSYILFRGWNINHQMRLISKDLGKLVPSKTNVQISSCDQNNDPNVQTGGGSMMTQFPLSGVLLSEQE